MSVHARTHSRGLKLYGELTRVGEISDECIALLIDVGGNVMCRVKTAVTDACTRIKCRVTYPD